MKKILITGIIAISIIACKQKEEKLVEVTEIEETVVEVSDDSKLSFEDYKVEINKAVKKAKIDFTNNPDAKAYITSIKETYNSSDVNFAGNYIVTTFGCGQACISGYIVDTRDGKVYDLPDTEDNNSWEGIGNGIEHEPNSSLLITKMFHGEGSGDNISISDHKKYWSWNESDKKFELIKYVPNKMTFTEEEYEKWEKSNNNEN